MRRWEAEEKKAKEDEEEEETDRKKNNWQKAHSSISFVSVGTIEILENRKTLPISPTDERLLYTYYLSLQILRFRYSTKIGGNFENAHGRAR